MPRTKKESISFYMDLRAFYSNVATHTQVGTGGWPAVEAKFPLPKPAYSCQKCSPGYMFLAFENFAETIKPFFRLDKKFDPANLTGDSELDPSERMTSRWGDHLNTCFSKCVDRGLEAECKEVSKPVEERRGMT